MKITFSLVTIILVLVLFGSQLSLTSCTKQTVTVRDTTIVNDTIPATALTNTQILVQQPWEVNEAYQDDAGTTTHYLRGGENTTGVSYDALRLVFNANGTGSNTNTSGNTYSMTWQFTTADQNNMTLVINGTVVNNWSLVKITDSSIIETTALSTGDLVSARWVPVP